MSFTRSSVILRCTGNICTCVLHAAMIRCKAILGWWLAEVDKLPFVRCDIDSLTKEHVPKQRLHCKTCKVRDQIINLIGGMVETNPDVQRR